MCSSQFNLLSSVRPRDLTDDTCDNFLSPNLKLHGLIKLRILFSDPITMNSVLVKFIVSLFAMSHFQFAKISRSSKVSAETVMLVSPAYIRALESLRQ